MCICVFVFESAVVTSTTVGYGDLYCTTPGGRIFACACTFLGIVVIAMPVTVLGTHFSKEYEREYFEEAERKSVCHGEGDEGGGGGGGGPRHKRQSSQPNCSSNSISRAFERSSFTDFGTELDRAESGASFTSRSFENTSRLSQGGGQNSFSPAVQQAEASVVRLEEMAGALQRCMADVRAELDLHRDIVRASAAAALAPGAGPADADLSAADSASDCADDTHSRKAALVISGHSDSRDAAATSSSEQQVVM
jgi:hypothetical protein